MDKVFWIEYVPNLYNIEKLKITGFFVVHFPTITAKKVRKNMLFMTDVELFPQNGHHGGVK